MIAIFFAINGAFTPTDEYFPLQFGLDNTEQYFGNAEEDIDVMPIWKNGIFGKGIHVNVVSDGCYYKHNDLINHFDVESSWNYKTWENDPTPSEKRIRGTQLAGIIGAEANDLCTIGVAPQATLSCFNIDENRTRENIIDSITRGNDKIRVKLLGYIERCAETCMHQEYDHDLHMALANAPQSVNFVSPAGMDAFMGGDTNFFPLNRDPRVTVISDTNHRGAHSSWGNRGLSILANAPAGGSSSFDDGRFPQSPGLGLGTDKCDNIDPVGTGAAYAAGAISLLLERNPQLTWRDVQAIILITANQNDPKHHSWMRNAAGFDYSSFYGFGRIDVEQMYTLGTQWKLLEKQVSSNFSKDVNQKLPTMRRGSLNITLQLDDKVKYIEYVRLSVFMDAIDASLLRINLTSPQGTCFVVKATSIGNDSPHEHEYYFTIRSLFGESAGGNWNLHLISDSVGNESRVINASIEAYGLEKPPRFTRPPLKKAKNPYSPLTDNPTVKVTAPKEVTCGTNFEAVIEAAANSNVTIYLGDKNRRNRWPTDARLEFPEGGSMNVSLHVPCFFRNNESLLLIAEDMERGLWGETDIRVANTESDLVLLQPNRYQVFRVEEGASARIDILPALQMRYWVDGSFTQRARVSLFDMDSEEIIGRWDTDMKDSVTVDYAGRACPHCLLSVVPSWHDVMHDCLAMVQPVSLIGLLDPQPQNWPIPLNDWCPVPPGVMTPTPTPKPTTPPQTPTPKPTETPPPPKQNIAAIAVGGSFLGLFVLFLALFLYCSRPRRSSVVYDSLLER